MHEQTLAAAIAAGWTDCFVQDGKVWGYANICDVMPQVFSGREAEREPEPLALIQFDDWEFLSRVRRSPVHAAFAQPSFYGGPSCSPYCIGETHFHRESLFVEPINIGHNLALVFSKLYSSGYRVKARIRAQTGQCWVEAHLTVRSFLALSCLTLEIYNVRLELLLLQ
jgi:hypothetical protein